MKKLLLLAGLTLLFSAVNAQKKVLDHSDFAIWNTIEGERISPDGKYILYSLEKGEKDNYFKLKDIKGNAILEYDRGQRGAFTYDSKYAIFTIKTWEDSVLEMKRRKVKKADLPKDTLGVYNIASKELVKIPNIKSHKMPEKWSGYLAFQQEEMKVKEKKGEKKEEGKKKKSKNAKKQNKKNGYHLVVHNLTTAAQDTFKYVTAYAFAKEGQKLAFVTTGEDSISNPGVFVHDFVAKSTNRIFEGKGDYKSLTLSNKGSNVAFMANLDTTDALIKPFGLYNWSGSGMAALMVDNSSDALPTDYIVSEHARLQFSKDESKLFFGTATKPILQDTSILDEEVVDVEVWTYDEPRLYTVQELQVERDKKAYYHSVIHLNEGNKIVNLADWEVPNTSLGDEGNADVAVVSTQRPYQLEAQWQGGAASDVYIVDLKTGDRTLVFKQMRGRASLSPKAKYVFGYDIVDSTWVTYEIASKKTTKLTDGKMFYQEIHDTPNFPRSYGTMGWMENDEAILIYDRYDIWKFNPTNANSGERLTKGRENKTSYRYLRLDNEKRFIESDDEVLMSAFREVDKSQAYINYQMKNGKMETLLEGNFSLSTPRKAKLSDELLYTKQTFEMFPNLIVSDLSFKNSTQVSNANPQQKDYNWGTNELVKWTSLDGIELEGMLVKPENFDPNKKYPMIVNFYEKSANGIHRHRPPSPGRSTISYSFYTSRGYVIFNPDVHYREGYPGESAYNCVIPGITKLIAEGFVDKDNIGVQGHSWGGYQIAYLVTKTDIFKCAEAGAPVPNMISAYGGIRWWTGLSRQFQYEHTQSRIAGTPWEYPMRYIENSPIFYIDKINTPLLIMHNDADGHVPWYQGIEFFVSLRRLGKPSWFLNYNGEPHWPLKRRNREDFNIRMQQFFDYYLKGEPMPVWMKKGVPAIQKGIQQNLELMESDGK